MSAPVSYSYQYPGLNKANSLSSKLEITISCKDLPKFDKLSESDPKIFIFIETINYTNNNTIWSQIDATERIKNNNNPIFSKKFVIDYYFETIQKLRFVVFDMDSKDEEWEKNDFVGYTEKTLAEIVSGSKNKIYSADLLTSIPSGINVKNSKAKKSSNNSKIIFKIEEYTDSPYKLKLDINGCHLDKK
eukprot:jgi/Orpsp1_1/1188565/evm.model.d7180000065771.1